MQTVLKKGSVHVLYITTAQTGPLAKGRLKAGRHTQRQSAQCVHVFEHWDHLTETLYNTTT